MLRPFARLLAALFLTLATVLCPVAASAQVRIAGAISGTVTDSADLVVPGARVVLKDDGTGIEKETVSNGSGGFSFPDLNFGSYQISVILEGFQTSLITKVIVEASRTTDVRIKLQVGSIGETVTVVGATPVLETSSNVISGTMNNKALNALPLAGRNTFGLARLVPGSVAPQGTGSTHYNGMPGGVINPTIDGINNSSNGWKSGGTSFFGTVPVRLGAVEEVTIESAGLGADSSSGGVNLKFVTRRGTNQYRGSAFEQARNDLFNANSYNNTSRGLPKAKLRRHDFGGNFGGPLVPTGPMREKLFIFLNYEQEYIPASQTITRTVLTPESQVGVFRYRTASGEERTANLLQIAAANGYPGTQDPTMAGLLAQQQRAQQYGAVSSTNSLITQSFQFLAPSTTTNYYPTARLDYQITPNLTLMGSWNLYRQDVQGFQQWPLPENPVQNQFHASWWITSTGLNWTINSNTFNEFRYGIQHSGDTTPGRLAEYYTQNGVVNGLPARFGMPLGLTTMTQDAAPITGRHYITTIYDTLTAIRGNHTLKTGGTFRLTDWRDTSLDGTNSAGFLGLPTYTIGSPAGDPVQNVFNASSMPGIQSTDLGNVYALYALMTGRVSRVRTGKILDPATLQYSDDVYRENWTASKMGGIFAQDSWRMTPNFTLNYGLKYEVNGSPYNKLGNANFPDMANLYGPSTALFQPGQLNGIADPVIKRGKYSAGIDWNNIAPNAGFAWTPMIKGGLLAKILGEGQDTVIRGNYARTYYDEGTNMFAFNAGSNPGTSQALDLQPGIGFAPGSLTLQSPLPAFVAFPLAYREVFPQADFTFTSGFRTLKDDLQTPSVDAWNVGLQRQLMKGTVIEVRYLGTRGNSVWRTYNVNEVNVFENGFLKEFKNAQTNLGINVANNRTGFANNGLPGQVALPIFDAAFGARGSQPALPAGSGYTNGTFITNLQQGTAGTLATSLAGSATYACRLYGSTFSPCARNGYDAPGVYPINFFLLNPFAGTQGAWMVDDQSFTKYHALQFQLRKRYDKGLQMNFNYTLAKNTGDIWADNSTQEVNYRTLRDKGLDTGPAPFDVRHVVNTWGTYDIPVGKGRHFDVSNPVLNAIVGGWVIGGTLTAQSGTPFLLTSGRATVNGGDGGVVLANGHTVEEIQSMIRVSPGPGLNRYWIDPKLIGADGRANAEYLAVPTTPGEFGSFIYLRGKNTWNLDASFNKSFALYGRSTLNLHVTMTNVFNHPIWGTPGFLGTANITSNTFGQVGNPLNGARQMYLRAEVRF